MDFNELTCQYEPNIGISYLVRTERYRFLQVSSEKWILYNILLNMPLIIGNEAREWFLLNDTLTNESFFDLNAATKTVVRSFVESYLYLPVGVNETDIIIKKNEVHMARFETGQTFEWLDLRVSEACNFGCPHCIAKEANYSRIMPEEMAKNCVDHYVQFKKDMEPSFNTIKIHFGNCEPLMNFITVKSVIEYVKKSYSQLNQEYSVNTNLSLLTKVMAQYFAQNKVAVYTSLDGPQIGNNKIRTYRDGKGTYSKILHGMKLMKEVGHEIKGISVTVTDENFPWINEEFFQWCKDMGFISVGLDFDLLHSTQLSNEEKVHFLTNTWENLIQEGIEFYGTWMTPFINLSNKSTVEFSYAFCKAAEGRNLSVDSDGNIYACSYSSSALSSIKTLKRDIQKGESYYNYVKSRLSCNISYPNCRSCVIEGACCGQCDMTRSCADTTTIDSQCNFYRLITDSMLVAQAKLLEEVE